MKASCSQTLEAMSAWAMRVDAPPITSTMKKNMSISIGVYPSTYEVVKVDS